MEQAAERIEEIFLNFLWNFHSVFYFAIYIFSIIQHLDPRKKMKKKLHIEWMCSPSTNKSHLNFPHMSSALIGVFVNMWMATHSEHRMGNSKRSRCCAQPSERKKIDKLTLFCVHRESDLVSKQPQSTHSFHRKLFFITPFFHPNIRRYSA